MALSMSDFSRLIAPLKRKIFLLIGRALLTAINNSGKTQTIQVTGLSGETITDVERMQDYGFESYPEQGEAVIVFLNGNRDQGVAIAVHDRENRPTDLTAGDTRMYTSDGNKITLKKGTGITVEDINGNKVELNSSGIKLTTTDASGWLPSVLAVDPFSGIPHGGPTAGIVKLTGG